MTDKPPIRVLLVDDSAVIRGLIAKALESCADTEVCGRAANGAIAVDQAAQLKPDIVILDIEMPVMDGLTALPKIIEACPCCKVIMASTLTMRNAQISLKALSLGASEYVAKPSAQEGNTLSTFYQELITKILALAGRPASGAVQIPEYKAPELVVKKVVTAPVAVKRISGTEKLNPSGITALAIVSSTGGPQALMTLFKQFNGRFNNLPIFITQHMPATFTTILAKQLSTCSGKEVIEATHKLPVKNGLTYVAPGDFHMEIARVGTTPTIMLNQNPAENFCRPAADPMLRSLSKVYGKSLCTIVLTGMGSDGCEGAKEVVNTGGSVVAQDEASSIVYGMPKAVVDAGICKAVLPLDDIASFIIKQVGGGA